MQIVGIDEVGRGALAGPVFVGAVVISGDEGFSTALEEVLGRTLADSKKLTTLQRERAARWLVEHAHCSTGSATAEEINELGIVDATRLAAGRALEALTFTHIEADAGLMHPMPHPTEWFIRGDETRLPILCASIVAKVARDSFMTELAAKHPEYFWEKNVGYGSKAHREAITAHGATPEHRVLFIRKTLRGRVSS